MTITAFTVAHSRSRWRRDSRLGARAVGAGRGGDRAVSIVFVATEIVRDQRGESSLTITRALARRLRLRPAARLRLCRRAGRGRPAARRDPARACCRSISASSSGSSCSSRRSCSPFMRYGASSRYRGGLCVAVGLCDRNRRGVLEHRAAGRDVSMREA